MTDGWMAGDVQREAGSVTRSLDQMQSGVRAKAKEILQGFISFIGETLGFARIRRAVKLIYS